MGQHEVTARIGVGGMGEVADRPTTSPNRRCSSNDLDILTPLIAVDPESLILMKQTQRAKDYPVIGELARLLPPEREVELTTDPIAFSN